VTRREGAQQFDNALGRLYRTCYIGVLLYIFGFLVLGVALQNHLSVGTLVMGWGIAVVAVMVNTVAVCASFSMPASEERLKVSSPQMRTLTTASRNNRARSAHC
jgi:hypothetical protein